jgi:hypothetical protein
VFTLVNLDRKPVDLSTGRVLAPGETATVKAIAAHEQTLIDQGQLGVREQPKPTPPRRGRKTTTQEA